MSAAPRSAPAGDSAADRDLLRRLAAGTAGVVGDAFLRALVHHLAAAFAADVAFVAEHVADTEERVRIVASWQRGVALPEGYEFDLDDHMPCSVVVRDGLLTLREGTCARYPSDEYVSGYGLDAYLGIEIPGADGGQLGYLALMSSSPLAPTGDEIAVLRIFAARAAAEIERRRHQDTLRARDAEVAAARARVMEAADGERQRIGRDLHDGAQQRIVALGHLIGIARRRLGDTLPGDVAELLDRAGDEARLATTELRELARGLHPAGLTEKGLAPALEALANRSPIQLDLGRLPERRLPAPVELTAYYLASEGVTNAVKYADATRVRFDVLRRPDAVVLTFSDDGGGGADAARGSGLSGLNDRVAALGGALRVTSPAGGGTTLQATIPLAPWRSAREPFLEFGHPEDGGQGDRHIERIIAGHKTLSVTLAREWDLEGGLPRIGQHLPVMDHAGRRRATVEVVRVAVLPFSEIGDDVVAGESFEVDSLDAWRELHRRFYEICREEIAMLTGQPGWRLTDEEPMVVTSFRPVAGDAGDGDAAAA